MPTVIRVLDVETTGLDPALHRICEIATVDIVITPVSEQNADGMTDPGKVAPIIARGRMWSSLVNPERKISPEAMGVHDITDDMVKDAPKLPDLLSLIKTVDDVQPGRTPDYFAAHNNRFDQRFINPVQGTPWIDMLRVAYWLWPEAPSHKNNVLRYWLGIKLDPMATGPDGARSHRALFDAYVTASLLRKAMMCGVSLEEMVEISSQPAVLPYFTFGEHAMKPIEQVPSSYLDWILSNFEKEKEDPRHTAFTELQRRRKSGAA